MATLALDGVFVDNSRYNLVKPISLDQNFKTVLVEDTQENDELVTAKVYDSSYLATNGYNQTKLLREVMILKSLKHPCNVNFKGFNFYNNEIVYDDNNDNGDPSSPTLYTEYMENGTLEDLTRRIEIGKCPSVWNNTKKQIAMISIASALSFLHRKKIIHRSINQKTIAFDKDFYAKVSDFGFSRVYDPTSQITMTQNNNSNEFIYQCPEFLVNATIYGPEVDCYSLGIIIFQIMTGEVPFKNAFSGSITPFQKMKKIENGERPTFPNGLNIPPKLQKMCIKLWSGNPSERPLSQEIAYHLRSLGEYCLPDVNKAEVNEFIRKIKDFEDKNISQIEICYIEGGVDIPKINEAKLAIQKKTPENKEVPSSPEEQLHMFRRILSRGFTIYKEDIILSLFTAMVDSKLMSNQYLCQISEFVNNCNINGNKKAEAFLEKVYGKYIVPIGATEVPDLNSTQQQAEIINIPPTVTKIGKTFSKCKFLKRINIPNSVTSIVDKAFNDCRLLRFVAIPNSMKVIQQSFDNLQSLKYVYIPRSVVEIKARAFTECESLRIVYFNKGLQIIGKRAFEYSRLREVEIPETIVSIGKNAFAHSKHLKKAIIHTNKADVAWTAFPHRTDKHYI